MTPTEAAALLEATTDPADLFGNTAPSSNSALFSNSALSGSSAPSGNSTPSGSSAPVQRYRELARLLHPDRAPLADRPAATAAFARLAALWEAYQGGVPIRSATSGTGYRLGPVTHRGDIANLYDVGAGRLLKLPRHPADNDLMDREAQALRTIARDGDPRFLPYVPRLAESFRHRDRRTGAERRVNVVAAAPGLRPLTEIRAAFPAGVPPRHVAWIWRRLLIALGLAHGAGVVHGAVLPVHILIEPADHGLVLADWCYSTVDGAAVPALVPGFADWYPAEVRAKRPPGPGTDLAMAATCVLDLLGRGTGVPRPLREFAAGCRQPDPRRRPDDAWRLLAELDEVLERLWGPRVFVPLHIPTPT